jgi:hypothetical protein
MTRSGTFLSSALLACLPALAGAQASPAQIDRARHPAPRSEVALELGVYSGGLSYARRVGTGPVSLGAGVWGAWEPASSFGRNVWEPFGVVAFARFRPLAWAHADAGLTAGRYLWADDCSECTGTLVGARSALLLGRGALWIGPELVVARASDARHGAELGVLGGVQARLLVGWGR